MTTAVYELDDLGHMRGRFEIHVVDLITAVYTIDRFEPRGAFEGHRRASLVAYLVELVHGDEQ